LYWFLDHPCAPDVVGLNYYLTSDRYLDERLEPYPASSLGGNGCDRYADVEAVRVSDYEGPAYGRILEDAWTRYGLPIALTEVHAGCTREDQLRWFVSAWQAASAARRRGVDVRAVTMWSLFGSFDWNSLVARDDNVYEVGTFDVRSTPPRRTALGTLAQALARGTPLDLLASQPGWWQRARRPTRFRTAVADFEDAAAPHPILIVGGTGTLGSAFTRACDVRGLRAVSVGRTQLDITSPGAIRRALVRWRPWAVINAAGYVRVDDAEATRDLCWRVNTDGALHLAEGAAACQARYVTFSTDLVFDGLGETPYVESDSTRPINTYGASKRAAEERVAALASDALIVRTAAFFGSVEHHGFLTRALREVSAGRELLAADDVVVSPTYVPHLVDAVLDLLIDGAHGIWHLANHGQVSWADFAVLAARFASLDDSLVRRVSIAELGLRARRPAFSALDSERGRIMPTLELGVTEYLASPVNVWGERRSRSRMASGHR
jgi:dTDP-4-dehydrorhamnose reductase